MLVDEHLQHAIPDRAVSIDVEAQHAGHETEAGNQAEQLQAGAGSAQWPHRFKVTMRTVQDIVNNCLNQLQLVRFEAEGHVSQDALATFDESIQETAAKLRVLGDLEAYTEHQMVAGTGLGPSDGTAKQPE